MPSKYIPRGGHGGRGKKSHGEGSPAQSVEYRSWAGMIQRCTNPKNPKYSYYGGKGVTICESWRNSYEAFLADMGRRPTKKHTLDRKDGSLGYCPSNCVWSTREEQSRNRSSVLLSVDQADQIRRELSSGTSQAELARRFGVKPYVVFKVARNITWKTKGKNDI